MPVNQSPVSAEVLFDGLNRSYESAFGNNAGQLEIIDSLKALIPQGSRILDVGCGTGKPTALSFAESGYAVTGIDVSQAMIDIAKEQVVNGTFMKMDMTEFQPEEPFDAVISILSIFQMPQRVIHSMMFKFSQWLRPGGIVVIGTIPIPNTDLEKASGPHKESGRFIEGLDLEFMGYVARYTLFTEDGWKSMLESAGFEILEEKSHAYQPSAPNVPLENHYYMIGRRTKDPLMGPYPLPSSYRGPHKLSQESWKPFAERLTRHEFDAVLQAIQDNKEVLDVGSGHGELPIAVAKRVGKSYAIEPNEARNHLLVENGREFHVQVSKGTAECLPFPDNKFDAVVAMWVLHYVVDLEASLKEMVRVIDPSAPNACIVIVQAAPDNEFMNLLNAVCVPIASGTEEPKLDHQGFLLHTAAKIFADAGFEDIHLEPVKAYSRFPEKDLDERCLRAAEIIANLWYYDHPEVETMKTALLPALKRNFKTRPWDIGDQAVMLVARPASSKLKN